MKKILFSLIALSLTIVSCNKEFEPNQQENYNNGKEQVNSLIPRTITASLDDILSKTSYTDDGKFTWSSDDQIAVYYTKTDGSGVHQGWLAYKVSELTDDDKTATFAIVSGQDAKEELFADYTPTGVAVYPISVARPYSSSSNIQEVTSYSGGTPFVTLGSSASTSLENITLTGVKQSDNTYKFKTAGSVLKVTISNLDPKVKSISLATSDKVNYPLTGDFILSETDGVYAYRFGTNSTFETYWSSDFSDRLTTSVSCSDGDSKTIYFNVPAGTYAADKLSLQIRTEDGEVVKTICKHIKKELTTTVNEVLILPELSFSYPSYSIAITNSATDPKMSFTTNYIRFCVLSSSTNDYSKYVDGMKFTDKKTNATYSLTGATYKNGGSATPSLTTSGKYYFHYLLKSTTGNSSVSSFNDSDIVEYGTIPFYYLASADATSYAGTYTMKYSNNGGGTISLTLAASDNPNKGNVKMTEFNGASGALYGIYLSNSSSQNLRFYKSYSIAFASKRYIYSSGYDLNMHLGFDGSGSSNYDSTTWDLICWNATLTDEIEGGTTTQYTYLRGNRNTE